MSRRSFQTFALMALASAVSFATPALAGSPYYDQPETTRAASVDARPMMPHGAGHFTCSYNERHTRLQRQACGGSSY